MTTRSTSRTNRLVRFAPSFFSLAQIIPQLDGRLFGGVHELRPVSTHAPVPELALKGVACTLDCRALNRDPCWLEANKCGECYDGFHGKAGHVNSPCGKVGISGRRECIDQHGEYDPSYGTFA